MRRCSSWSALTISGVSAWDSTPAGTAAELAALRAEALACDGARTADELLVEALAAPDRLVTIDHRTARQAARVARTLATIRAQNEEAATVDELLWTAWSDARVAETWAAEARGSGTTAAEEA